MTKTTSFQADIRPLFTERDIQGMRKAFNLASYDDVKKHAGAIHHRISWNRRRRNAARATKRRRSLAAIAH